MKIVYSYVPSETGPIKDLTKFLEYSKVSFFYSRKLSDNIVLYTTSEIKEIIQKYGIPYDDINTELFDNYEGSFFNYAIPKILTYIEQKEPYIHIDFDTILFKLPNITNDVYFGYYDYTKNNNSEIPHSYLNDYNKISNKLKDDIMKNYEIVNIPNFSLFGVNNPTMVSDTFKKILEFYDDNKLEFDNMDHGPSQLEQFLFYPFLLKYHDVIEPFRVIGNHNTFMINGNRIFFNDNDSFDFSDVTENTLNSYIELSVSTKNFDFIHLIDVKMNRRVEIPMFNFFKKEMRGKIMSQKIL